MIIDILKLENCKKFGNKIVSRCPACQELGQDKTGNHLIIYEDGRFGCVVYPSGSGTEHRKRIFQLIGKLQKLKSKIAIKEASQESHKSDEIIIKDVLGRLGRNFSTCLEKQSFYKDKELEALTELYLDITKLSKALNDHSKLSGNNIVKNDHLLSLENSFSSKWNELDEYKQKELFEAFCERVLVPNIIRQTVNIFNARVVSLV